MNVLVTGGAGYIGSVTSAALIKSGFGVVIVDNFYNSKPEAVANIEKITGTSVGFYQGDVCDKVLLKRIFAENSIDAVIHFAGYKAVGESVEKPIEYYRNNLDSTLSLLEEMKAAGVKKFVFSSSATVYGLPKTNPITEEFPLSATNPYGQTKLMIEQILKDASVADANLEIALLRYFNPVGADDSKFLGEDPNGIPNNLVPYICKVAAGELASVNVFGNDYDTPDGTGVRDYIHVRDLAKGHIAALERIKPGANAYNLGTGQGYSVLDIINTFSKVNDIEIPYEIVARRPGDIAMCVADATKAKAELNWTAELGLSDMCKSAWEFISHK
jgi:UDP-glucose-4-epimerase